jgi:hypothetical protein
MVMGMVIVMVIENAGGDFVLFGVGDGGGFGGNVQIGNDEFEI